MNRLCSDEQLPDCRLSETLSSIPQAAARRKPPDEPTVPVLVFFQVGSTTPGVIHFAQGDLHILVFSNNANVVKLGRYFYGRATHGCSTARIEAYFWVSWERRSVLFLWSFLPSPAVDGIRDLNRPCTRILHHKIWRTELSNIGLGPRHPLNLQFPDTFTRNVYISSKQTQQSLRNRYRLDR
jgi:hypothetical protein